MSKEPILKKSQTDWQRLNAMSEEDINLLDCPEVTPEMFANAVVRSGLPVVKNKSPRIKGRKSGI